MRTMEQLQFVREDPSNFSCLDAQIKGTLLNWVYMRDSSESGKFSPTGTDRRNLTITIDVKSIWGIDQKQQKFDAKFFVKMWWDACGVRFDGTRATAGDRYVVISEAPLWEPALLFKEFIYEIDPADAAKYWVISGDGRILRNVEYISTYKCTFDFTKLPFDKQQCTLTFRPVRESTEQLIFANYSIIVREGGLTSTEWTIDNFTLTRGTITQAIVADYLVPYSELTLSFTLTRNPRFYMVSIVWPTTVIWALSFCGLFVSADAAPARAALALIPVLIVINTQSRMYAGLPPMSYMTRLDKFLLAVILLLLGHLIEFCLMSFCKSIVAKAAKVKAEQAVNEDGVPWPTSKRICVAKWWVEHSEAFFKAFAFLAFVITLIWFSAGPA